MFRNDKNRSRVLGGGLANPAYELGSLESRGAARALVNARLANPQNKLRVVVKFIGEPFILAETRCSRNLCPDGTLIEMVEMGATDQQPSERLEHFIRSVPIDGKKYGPAEVGCNR